MTGIEVALAVIPLLVSVAEHYKTAYEKFKRWRSYCTKLKEFEGELFCYEGLFRNDCRSLLKSITDPAEVQRILDSHNPEEWRNADLGNKLITYLGDLFQPWQVMMGNIERELKLLYVKAVKFRSGISQSDPVCFDILSLTTSCDFGISGINRMS